MGNFGAAAIIMSPLLAVIAPSAKASLRWRQPGSCRWKPPWMISRTRPPGQSANLSPRSTAMRISPLLAMIVLGLSLQMHTAPAKAAMPETCWKVLGALETLEEIRQLKKAPATNSAAAEKLKSTKIRLKYILGELNSKDDIHIPSRLLGLTNKANSPLVGYANPYDTRPSTLRIDQIRKVMEVLIRQFKCSAILTHGANFDNSAQKTNPRTLRLTSKGSLTNGMQKDTIVWLMSLVVGSAVICVFVIDMLENRKDKRKLVRIKTIAALGDNLLEVSIHDISKGGARVSPGAMMSVGDTISLRIHGRFVNATVRWVDDKFAGVQFEKKISMAHI